MSRHRVFVFSEGDVEADDVFRKVKKLEEGTRLLRAGPANHSGKSATMFLSIYDYCHLHILPAILISGIDPKTDSLCRGTVL